MPTRTYTHDNTAFTVIEDVEGSGDFKMQPAAPISTARHLSARLTAEMVADQPTIVIRFHTYAPAPAPPT